MAFLSLFDHLFVNYTSLGHSWDFESCVDSKYQVGEYEYSARGDSAS